MNLMDDYKHIRKYNICFEAIAKCIGTVLSLQSHFQALCYFHFLLINRNCAQKQSLLSVFYPLFNIKNELTSTIGFQMISRGIEVNYFIEICFTLYV